MAEPSSEKNSSRRASLVYGRGICCQEEEMLFLNIMSVVAILLSPLIAVRVSMWLQKRGDDLRQKRAIFAALMATRHRFLSDEAVKALNVIDVVFHDNARVRELWKEYMEMVNNQGLNNDQGNAQRGKKNLEMVQAMAEVVGFGKITHLDVDRFYLPVGLAEERKRANEIANEVLRVLKESQGIKIVQKENSEKLGSETKI
jgi:hypothetical protein